MALSSAFAALAAVGVAVTSTNGLTTANTNQLAMAACSSGVRYSGFVANQGPGVVWVNRTGSATTNGHALSVGGSYSISSPLRTAAEWFGVDNGPVYLYSTNACTWTSEQSIVRE